MKQGLLYVMSLFFEVQQTSHLFMRESTGGHIANTVIIIHPDGPLVTSVDCRKPPRGSPFYSPLKK